MSLRIFGIGVFVLAIGALVFWPGGDEEDEVASELRRRENRQRDVVNDPDDLESIDFDALAIAGKGQPLPESLIAEVQPGGFWLVGSPKLNCGVEIPFAPGHIPAPPSSVEFADENPGFLGADACQECHQERHADFLHTAHHRTSALASDESIVGSFETGKNRLSTEAPEVFFEMLRRDDQFFQRVSFHDWKFEVPFHVVTGSSTLAQTFLYWDADRLYQMNVSYLRSADQWINSPGYIDGDAAYARQIGSRCLECHTTYVQRGEARNQYDPTSLITGISCERCHGPGKQHVEYHRSHPDEKQSRFISAPSQLSRQQQLDICGQCHTGVSRFKTGPYQFRPGDELATHYEEPDDTSANSVHTSNQLKRLLMSPCFLESEMTCTDCHNPHREERGDMELFSERCIKCHQVETCGMHDRLGEQLSDNCIDCHMGNRGTDKLWLKTSNETIFPKLRDHHIRVDQDATKWFLENAAVDGE